MKELTFEQLKEKFAEAIVKLSNGEAVVTDLGTQLGVKRTSSSMDQFVSLESAWKRYSYGESVENLIKVMIEPLFYTETKDITDMTWDEVKTKIFPQLKELSAVEQPNSVFKKAGMLYKKGVLPLVAVCYVIDVNDAQMVYVTDKISENWSVDINTIHLQSVENLKNLPGSIQKIEDKGVTLYVSQVHDSYDSSRILTLNYDEIKSQFEGEVMIGIPNRDFMIIFDSKASYVNFFAMNVVNDYNNRPYPIVPFVYMWDGKNYQPAIIQAKK